MNNHNYQLFGLLRNFSGFYVLLIIAIAIIIFTNKIHTGASTETIFLYSIAKIQTFCNNCNTCNKLF